MSYDAFISYSHASDAQLAPALQRALHRFAKPWYKLRQLHIFRDATSLTANPRLWSAIEAALQQANWFLLIAGPKAAQSQWVCKEVTWWLENKPHEKLLIVLSDGEIAWDDSRDDFDWSKTTALPPVMLKQFAEEPLFVDLRWTRTEADLSPSSPRFIDAVATLAAPLNGKAKEELIGEDFSQHRRLKYLVVLVLGLLTALTLVAGYQWHQAVQQRNEARAQAIAFRANDARDRKRETLARLLAALSLKITPTQAAKDTAIALFAGQPAFSVSIIGHQAGVTGVAFSPDDRTIVSSSWDNTLRFWDAYSGSAIGGSIDANPEPIADVPPGVPGDPNQGQAQCVAFTPDGKRIVSSGNGAKLRFWDVNSRRMVGRPLIGLEGAVTSIAFSQDGHRMVSGGYQRTVLLWNLSTGKPLALRGHTDIVSAVAFSPDGSRVASGGIDHTIRLWDAHTGAPIGAPLMGHTSGITGLAFTQDGLLLVSGGDNTVRTWNAATGKPEGIPLAGHEGPVTALAISRDGRHIVSGDSANTLRLWDAGTGQMIGTPLTGHEGRVTSIAFSKDGTRIVSGSEDHTVRLWNLQPEHPFGLPLPVFGDGTKGVAFSPDSKRILGFSAGGMTSWDARTGQPRLDASACTAGPSAVAVSPDGKLIVGVTNNVLHLCDAQTGQPLGKAMISGESIFLGVAFSPDSKRIVSAGGDRMVRLWDASTQEEILRPLRGHTEPVYSVAFSPEGTRILSGSADGTLRLWDAHSGQPLGTPLTGHSGVISSVAFSPDGNYIVSGSYDQTLRLWDARAAKPIGAPLAGHTGWISAVAFSTDGRLVVSGSLDGTLRLWDVHTRNAIGAPLLGHNQGVTSVAFSADGKRLASGGFDTFVRLWDAEALVSADALHDLLCASARRELSDDESVLNVPAAVRRLNACGENRATPMQPR